MEYTGKLYGKIGKKTFDTGKTSEDWDNLAKDQKRLNWLLYGGKITPQEFRELIDKQIEKEELKIKEEIIKAIPFKAVHKQ
jgi:hypothetical protein